MKNNVVSYNVSTPASRIGGSYEYPRPSGRSASTTSRGSASAHKQVKITLPRERAGKGKAD